MSDDAIIGTGILLRAGDGATPENFVTVAENVVLKPPQLSRTEIEVTTHNEAKTSGESKALGILRKGQATGTCNWLPTDPTHSPSGDGLLADILANKLRNWRIEFPPNSFPRFTFPGRVQLFDIPEVGVDTPLQTAFALTVAGAITIVEA